MKLLFWSFFIAIFWCYAGYPLAMRMLAAARSVPLLRTRPPASPRVSVVLAVRNGAAHLNRRLENLLQQDHPGELLEILVVCNGCSDASVALADAAARADSRIRVLVTPVEQGKAGALNLGAEHATGEFILFADVRQAFAPDVIRRLLEPFADPRVGAASGRLEIQRADRPAVEGMRLYWGFETQLRLAESRTGSAVGATGAVYMIRRECFEPIPANLILDDVWLPMRIAMQGYRVLLVTEAVAYDTPSVTPAQEYARKRRTMVGNLQLVRALPSVLHPLRNPLWVRFLSHKLLRVVSPFLFVGTVISSALVPELPYQAYYLVGVATYLLGGLGLVLPIPFLSVASAFVLMHLAIFSAVRRFREDASSVWTAPAGAMVVDGVALALEPTTNGE